MTGGPIYLGLASPEGTGAKSLGAVVRSGLAGAAVGIAVAAVIAFGTAPALAGHDPGHDEVARGKIGALEDGVHVPGLHEGLVDGRAPVRISCQSRCETRNRAHAKLDAVGRSGLVGACQG